MWSLKFTFKSLKLSNAKQIVGKLQASPAALTTMSPPCLLSAKCHVIKWQPLFELTWRHGEKKECSYSIRETFPSLFLRILILRWLLKSYRKNILWRSNFFYPKNKARKVDNFERGMGTKLAYSLALMYIFVLFAIRGHIGKEERFVTEVEIGLTIALKNAIDRLIHLILKE